MALSALAPATGTPPSSATGNAAGGTPVSPAGLFAGLLAGLGHAGAADPQAAGAPGTGKTDLAAALEQLAAQLKGETNSGSLKETLRALLKAAGDGASTGQARDTSLDALLKRLSADQGSDQTGKPADGESPVDQLAALLQPLLAGKADRPTSLDLSALNQRLPRESGGGDASLDGIRRRLDAIAGAMGHTSAGTGASPASQAETDNTQTVSGAMGALLAGQHPSQQSAGKADGQPPASLFQALQTATPAAGGNAAPSTAELQAASANGDAKLPWQGALLDAARGDATQTPLNTFTAQAGGAPGSTSGHAAGAASTPTPASATLSAPVASAQWQQGLGQQLVQLHQRGGQQVQLHLHPAELGPLSVQLKVDDQLAQAQFLSHNPQVRAAIEQAIPQLRAALNEAGIQLGEAMVGEQPQPGQQDASDGSGNSASGNPASGDPASGALAQGAGEGVDNEAMTTLTTPLGARAGGVDLYA